MSEFEAEVKKAETGIGTGPRARTRVEPRGQGYDDEFLGDLKMQAQEYGQKIQDAAVKAKDFANDKVRRGRRQVQGALRPRTRRNWSRTPRNLPAKNRARRSSSQPPSAWS